MSVSNWQQKRAAIRAAWTPEERLADSRARHAAMKASGYYERNRDRLRENRRRSRIKHAPELRASNREYMRIKRAANPEWAREESRRWRERNPLALRASQYRYYWSNRDKRIAANAEWYARNPDWAATKDERRRVAKLGNGGSHTTEQWLEKKMLFANCCAYCGEAKPLARDHRIPLSRGGSNDISNIVPACKACNSQKHTRTDLEFIAHRALRKVA